MRKTFSVRDEDLVKNICAIKTDYVTLFNFDYPYFCIQLFLYIGTFIICIELNEGDGEELLFLLEVFFILTYFNTFWLFFRDFVRRNCAIFSLDILYVCSFVFR